MSEEAQNVLNSIPVPGTGAEGTALDELFRRDPLKLTDQDLSTIVAFMREERKKWLITDAAKANKKSAKKAAPSANINLGDLFNDEGN